MSDVVLIGDGSPVTVFASGQGAGIADTAALAVHMRGRRVFFEYGQVAPWADRPRREADRDADELLAVADEHGATRAVGVSRGARAVLGVLAMRPDRFERVALVWPPGGSAVGRYADWLAPTSCTREPRATVDSRDVEPGPRQLH